MTTETKKPVYDLSPLKVGEQVKTLDILHGAAGEIQAGAIVVVIGDSNAEKQPDNEKRPVLVAYDFAKYRAYFWADRKQLDKVEPSDSQSKTQGQTFNTFAEFRKWYGETGRLGFGLIKDELKQALFERVDNPDPFATITVRIGVGGGTAVLKYQDSDASQPRFTYIESV